MVSFPKSVAMTLMAVITILMMTKLPSLSAANSVLLPQNAIENHSAQQNKAKQLLQHGRQQANKNNILRL